MNNNNENTNNISPKSKLGRGLSSLLGEKNLNFNNDLMNIDLSSEKILKLDINLLIPNKNQPRKYFNENDLIDLSNSIKEHGVLEPIIVRKINDKYEIIAGERRYRASKMANLDVVPVIVKNLDDKQALTLSIIENIQRTDLSVIEEAEAYNSLMKNFNYTQEDVSKIVGKSRSHIANLLRLLSLPDNVIELIYQKKIDMGHARAIINSTNPYELAKIIIENKLSVRETEELVKQQKEVENNINPDLPENLDKLSSEEFINLIKNTPANENFDKNNSTKKINTSIKENKEYIKNIEKSLFNKINLKTKIVFDSIKNKGKIVIKYNSMEELNNFINNLK